MSQSPDENPRDPQPPVAPPPPPYQQGYPLQPGAPVPPVYGPPGSAQGFPPNSDERLWAVLAHASYFVLSIIGPLVIMLTKGKESPFVRQAAVEALNFHLTLLIYAVVSFVLIFVFVGILTLLATIVFGIVVTILALVATNNGQAYRYPLCIRMVT